MITNNGKDIIAKFLVGQVPSYAAYLAFGCGPKPLASDEVITAGLYANKTSLDFETFRAPIISRGYVTDIIADEAVSSIILTAELPTEQRYGITEVGVYSAKNNPVATSNDSQLLYNFTEVENWEFHNDLGAAGLGDVIYDKIDATAGIIQQTYALNHPYTAYDQTAVDPSGIIYNTTLKKAYPFRTVASSLTFGYGARVLQLETCRVLDTITVVPGNMSNIQTDMTIKPTDVNGYYGSHIHLSGIRLDLDRNSPTDELKLAFSVINRDASTPTMVEPGDTRIVVEFSSDDLNNPGNYARLEATVSNDIGNRYHVVIKKLSELSKSAGFTWSAVSVVKIYVSVLDGVVTDSNPKGVITDNFFVCLDAMRFDNVTSISPVYTMSGYTVIRSETTTRKIITKEANTTNSVEFRFGLNING